MAERLGGFDLKLVGVWLDLGYCDLAAPASSARDGLKPMGFGVQWFGS